MSENRIKALLDGDDEGEDVPGRPGATFLIASDGKLVTVEASMTDELGRPSGTVLEAITAISHLLGRRRPLIPTHARTLEPGRVSMVFHPDELRERKGGSL